MRQDDGGLAKAFHLLSSELLSLFHHKATRLIWEKKQDQRGANGTFYLIQPWKVSGQAQISS